MNKKIVTTLIVQTVLIVLIYTILGLATEGVIVLILTSVIALTLIIAFLFEPSKREDESEIINEKISMNSSNSKNCYICSTKNKNQAKFCRKCGTSLISITCPVCHKVNEFDQKYCIQCETILQNKKRH